MSLTPYEKAQRAASHIVLAARENKAVITRKLIAEVIERLADEGKECASAHPRTLVTAVRHYARAFDHPVALRDKETEFLWRAVFKHLTREQATALREKVLAEQPELQDSRGFEQAFSVTYFPKNCNSHWTHLPAVYVRWGRDYAWTFVTGLESIAENGESA